MASIKPPNARWNAAHTNQRYHALKGFFRPKQSSVTRKIIWHGSTSFLVLGFTWAAWATFKNESTWKNQERGRIVEYEELVESYRKKDNIDTENGHGV